MVKMRARPSYFLNAVHEASGLVQEWTICKNDLNLASRFLNPIIPIDRRVGKTNPS